MSSDTIIIYKVICFEWGYREADNCSGHCKPDFTREESDTAYFSTRAQCIPWIQEKKKALVTILIELTGKNYKGMQPEDVFELENQVEHKGMGPRFEFEINEIIVNPSKETFTVNLDKEWYITEIAEDASSEEESSDEN